MTFGQFISILRARWWVVALVLVLVVGGTVAVSLLLPKQYTATATVLVDAKPDPVSAMLYAGGASPTFVATQVDVIQSERVALRVVRNLKLAESPEVRQQWQEATRGEGNLEQWLADSFQSRLDVKPSRESSVINVSYKAPDPRFAAGLANAFVQAYMDTTLELRVDPAKQFGAFFDLRAKEAREALERAQSKLSAFQREKGIIATDERLDVENARLNELSSQVVISQAIVADSSSRQTQAQGGSNDKMQEVLNNPLISGLKADLSRSEGRLQELNNRLGENHPQVQEARANIEEVRKRIEIEIKRVSGGVGVSANINRARESQLRGELELQRAKVLRMKAVRDEGQVLVREVDNQQRNYDTVLTRLTQSNLESQTKQTSVSVLNQAAVPLTASSPKMVLNAVIAAIVGTILAVTAAFMLEVFDSRIRAPEDASMVLGVPLIGVISKPRAFARIGIGRGPQMQQRVLGKLRWTGSGN